MNLREDIRFATQLLKSKAEHLRARKRACSWGEVSHNKRLATLVRQIRVLKQVINTLLAKDGALAKRVASSIVGVDLRMPKWVTSSWSSCSASCGVGHQRRTAVCKVEGKQVADKLCRGPAPALKRACSLKPCKRTFHC